MNEEVKNLRFSAPKNVAFFGTLKSRVDAYFEENNYSKHANAFMVFKTFFYTLGIIAMYLTILYSGWETKYLLLMTIPLGMFTAFHNFNVGHDAIHGAYSSNPLVNKVLGFSFNIFGANEYLWRIMHNVAHHTYTNVAGYDEDIDVAPGLIRLSPKDEFKPWMRFQKYYGFMLYSLASFSWVLRKDYKKFFQKSIGPVQLNHPPIEYFNLFFFKIVYYILFLAIPYMVLDYSFGQIFLGFFVMHLAEGLVLGLVFQLAHVVEQTDFPEPVDGAIDDSWAEHQLRTTADFAPTGWLATFLCGGLNCQVEHHLFPTICHVHYPALSLIVKKTAEEFDLPYNENKTFLIAIKSHYNMLDKFGRPNLV